MRKEQPQSYGLKKRIWTNGQYQDGVFSTSESTEKRVKMIVTKEQIDRLKRYAPGTLRFIEEDNLGEFLTVLDDYIVDDIMKHEDNEPGEIGIELQKIYDQVYNQNQAPSRMHWPQKLDKKIQRLGFFNGKTQLWIKEENRRGVPVQEDKLSRPWR